MNLPLYFKSIIWFADLKNITLKKNRDLILFQAFEKGRMEHLNYLEKKLGKKILYEFAKKSTSKFSRKSILPFLELMYRD